MPSRGEAELGGEVMLLKPLQKHQKFCVPNLFKEVPFHLFKNLLQHVCRWGSHFNHSCFGKNICQVFFMIFLPLIPQSG